MMMPPYIISILIGLFLLYLGAEALIYSSAKIANRFGLSPLVIGIVIIGYGTSTPELFVTAQAVLGHHVELAIGNIIGSNLFNLGVILSLVLLVKQIPIQASLRQLEIPTIIFSTILFWTFLTINVKPVWIGIIFLLLLTAYTLVLFPFAKRECQELFEAKVSKNWILPLLIAMGSLVVLNRGSNFLIQGSLLLAQAWDLSESFVGQTVVAVGTSMPELCVTIIALSKNHGELALGNIIGSNIFNILGVFGVSAFFLKPGSHPFPLYDFLLMAAMTSLFALVVYQNSTTRRRHGLYLLGCYGLYGLSLLFL
jgi:cation:H+ antiporter